MKELMDLSNRKILVTGASSGIGRAIARKISQVGGNVVLVGRNEAELQRTAEAMDRPNDHLPFVYDLTDIDNIKGMIEQVVNADGVKLAGVVHAAGVEAMLPLKFVTYRRFDEVMRLHLYSFIEIVKAIADRRYGDKTISVVVLSSTAAAAGGKCQTVYSASKGAVDAAIIPLSKELADRSVRLNSIRPSIIRTPMTEKWAAKKGIEDLAELEGTQLLGLGQPEDVAHLALFLLSDVSKFITGKSIAIDGGGPRDSIF